MAATASSSRPMPLLRRPLPPKQLSTPPRSLSPSPTSHYEKDSYDTRSKSPVSPLPGRTKSKLFSPLRGRQYHGDVPLPDTSVVQPYKPRGPAPLPARPPKKVREYPADTVIKNVYERPPPRFTLKNFMQRLPSRCGEDRFETMVSEQNYEKLTSWFAANRPKQTQVHSLEIDSSIEVPDVTPRKPPRQLSIEMRVPEVGMDLIDTSEQDMLVYSQKIAKMLPVTPATSKQTIPSRQRPLPAIEQKLLEEPQGTEYDGTATTQEKVPLPLEGPAETKTIGHPTVTEIVAPQGIRSNGQAKKNDEKGLEFPMKQRINFKKEVEEVDEKEEKVQEAADTEAVDSREMRQVAIMKEKALTFVDWPQVICYPESEVILPSSAPAFFQGEAIPRTSSPFVSTDEYQTHVSPLEAVILNAIVTGSATFNIKAHFLCNLPSLIQLSDTLTHLNASFNDFWVFPPEILELKLLVSLKLRNNPIKEIPHDISTLSQLKVLEMSFNLLISLPASLFELQDLEILDFSYNRLSFIPSEISNLRYLRELNLEGNQLGAMPVGTLYLQLKYFRIGNNYIHPLFWRETASNQPQRLLDLCALTVAKTDQDTAAMVALPEPLKALLKNPSKCDCCGGPKFGEGLRVIKSMDEVFGVRNLPFLFSACTQKCRKKFIKNRDAMQLWLWRNNTVVSKTQ